MMNITKEESCDHLRRIVCVLCFFNIVVFLKPVKLCSFLNTIMNVYISVPQRISNNKTVGVTHL